MEISVRKAQYSTLHLQRLVEQRQAILLGTPQRREWTTLQKVAFLETILLGIPVPAIYLQETKEGQYRIVDGYNRIKTILEFLENQVVLEGLPFLSACEGRRFQELDGSLRGSFEDFQLTFYVLPEHVAEALVSELRARLQITDHA